jgi:signal transduction histidine kinase
VARLRELAAGIHPAMLTNRGLAAALESLVVSLPIPVARDVTDLRLAETIEASIYFFCSEAVTNVVKYSGARSAALRVTVEPDHCPVGVHDDGVGSAQPRSDTTGLIGLHDRVGALEGTLEIVSPVGGGTLLRAAIPMRSEPDADGPNLGRRHR